MAKVLFLVANFYPTANSVSKQVATEFINHYISYNAKDEIKVLNLCEHEFPIVDYPILDGWDKLAAGADKASLPKEQQRKMDAVERMCDEFVSADKYVVVAPNWNLMVPPQLVNYMLSVCRVGRTFNYFSDHIEPLLKEADKKVLTIVSSGYVCTEPGELNYFVGMDWMRNVFRLCGVENFDSILVEGVDQYPEKRDEIITTAKVEAEIYAKTF